MTAPLIPANEGEVERLRRAAKMALDLLEAIKQTRNNVWYVDASDPESAVCDTYAALEAALSTPAQSGEGLSEAELAQCKEMFEKDYALSPDTSKEGAVDVREAQDRNREKLVYAISTFCDNITLPGEDGDSAYDLLRQAAAQIGSDRLALQRLRASPPPIEVGAADVRWRERWYGSEPQKGSAIVDEKGNLIAYLGGDETTHAIVTAIVAAHNAALRASPPPVEAGMVMVPVKPTEAMVSAGLAANEYPDALKVWSAMLSAAPKDMEEGR